jgi:hypothetical protein
MAGFTRSCSCWSSPYFGSAEPVSPPPGIFGVSPCYPSCSPAFLQHASICHAACCRASFRPF